MRPHPARPRMLPAWAILALALLVGAAIAMQAGVNATLGKGLQSPVQSAFVSFAVGTLALAVVLVAMRESFVGTRALAGIPLWAWTGGLLGAFLVAASVEVAPRMGAAAFLAAVIAGQLLTALVLDQYGWLGFEERVVTWRRAGAVALIGAGALLMR